MKPTAALSPSDHGIKGHVPDEAHDDHSQEDGACYSEIAAAIACLMGRNADPSLTLRMTSINPRLLLSFLRSAATKNLKLNHYQPPLRKYITPR